MTNRLTEQGVLQSNGQMQHAFSENKDLLSQYKTSETFRETNSVPSGHHRGSPRAASPNSSEGSVGALSSPFSSMFDSTKTNGFSTRFDANSPSIVESRKEASHHFGFHPTGLPLSPVSPLSPLNAAATARFLFHNSVAKSLHAFPGMSKLYNADLSFAAYPSRFLPIHALNPVLKHSNKETDINQNIGECYADVPEQERPIDLSVKRANALSGAALKALAKSSKSCVGDHDSGFSPSSNEENNNVNTSPLDLTAKRTPDPPKDQTNDDCDPSDSDEERNSQMDSNDDKWRTITPRTHLTVHSDRSSSKLSHYVLKLFFRSHKTLGCDSNLCLFLNNVFKIYYQLLFVVCDQTNAYF